jgi:guanine deaminase
MRNPFLSRAIELARENVLARRGGPFGSVIVKGGEILAEGVNQVTMGNDPTAHAEIVAIRNACHKLQSFELRGCEVYSSCEPCPMCLAAIYWSRAESIHFAGSREDAAAAGFDDAFLYEQVALPSGQRSVPVSQAQRDEAQAVFQLWREDYGKVRY